MLEVYLFLSKIIRHSVSVTSRCCWMCQHKQTCLCWRLFNLSCLYSAFISRAVIMTTEWRRSVQVPLLRPETGLTPHAGEPRHVSMKPLHIKHKTSDLFMSCSRTYVSNTHSLPLLEEKPTRLLKRSSNQRNSFVVFIFK